MNGQGRPWRSILMPAIVITIMSADAATASDSDALPTPLQDDAALLDVQFVGARNGWAVGERGAVWKSDDAGRSWQFVSVPTTATLRGVSFLTDRVGWIAGGSHSPQTRLSRGVVLHTNDGGKTWQPQAEGQLPSLTYIRFFDLTNGVAVGESSHEHPTGVFQTEDGGKTWQSMPGPALSGWRAAEFRSPTIGVVAGQRGRVALIGGGRILKPRMEDAGLRCVRSVALSRDDTGWLVGDGGLVLHTENGGVVWQEPNRPLPFELRETTDFRAVATRGDHVWIAGSPGRIVWHSDDAGTTWEKLDTGHTAPLLAMAFTSETEGCAVGEFGAILKTSDGGQTWTAIRGSGRRAALLCVHAWPGRVSFEMLAKHSGDQGYRSVVLLPPRLDVGPDGQESRDLDLRVRESILGPGGNVGELGWRLPIGIPGLDKDADKLAADWNRWTEGRLPQIFLGSLVASLRTWRPSVVVLDQPPEDDAASQLINDAILKAVEQAADATRYIHHQELAGLEPWQVERVYLRLPPGSAGQAHVDPHEYLVRTGKTARVAAALSRRLVAPTLRAPSARESYKLLIDGTNGTPDTATPRDFFAGLPMLPNSDARRPLPATLPDDEKGRAIATRQRNFQAFAERYAGDPREGAQVIAQLREITAGMTPEQGAQQLAGLIEEYRRCSRWDLVESTSVELVTRYPDEPASIDAMRWLFILWTGAEPAWQRARRTTTEVKKLESDPSRIYERIAKVSELVSTEAGSRDLTGLDLSPDPLKFTTTSGDVSLGGNQGWRSGAVRHWHGQALRMASLLRTKDPQLYRQPEIQFPLAALMRHRGVDRFADAVYRRTVQNTGADAWKRSAETELWMTQPVDLPPKKIVTCRTTTERPVLDGVLSDPCWQQAEEIRLTAREGEERDDGNFGFAMIARDGQHLYFAASLPRSPGTPPVRPERGGRTYDSDLSRFDRISICLDIDRDYATYYALHIDQRGYTAESCWDDTSWNPKWYVAADSDETHWRIEAAIPLSELTPTAPAANTLWGVGLLRTIPTVGYESWTHPATGTPKPETFGLVRFD